MNSGLGVRDIHRKGVQRWPKGVAGSLQPSSQSGALRVGGAQGTRESARDENFLSHELIARDLFNEGFSSGHGATEQWVQFLTNGSDQKLEA